MIFKTRSLQEGAMFLAQDQFECKFEELEAIDGQYNKFKFVLNVDLDDAGLRNVRQDYVAGYLRVEPKTYDAKLNTLRDSLSLAKG